MEQVSWTAVFNGMNGFSGPARAVEAHDWDV
jgi:hypothetical protein